MSRMTKPLELSRRHRKIAGVCGGLAEWLGWDPTVVRVLYVLVSVLSAAFPGILVYLVLWVVMVEHRQVETAVPGYPHRFLVPQSRMRVEVVDKAQQREPVEQAAVGMAGQEPAQEAMPQREPEAVVVVARAVRVSQ